MPNKTVKSIKRKYFQKRSCQKCFINIELAYDLPARNRKKFLKHCRKRCYEVKIQQLLRKGINNTQWRVSVCNHLSPNKKLHKHREKRKQSSCPFPFSFISKERPEYYVKFVTLILFNFSSPFRFLCATATLLNSFCYLYYQLLEYLYFLESGFTKSIVQLFVSVLFV